MNDQTLAEKSNRPGDDRFNAGYPRHRQKKGESTGEAKGGNRHRHPPVNLSTDAAIDDQNIDRHPAIGRRLGWTVHQRWIGS
ncbi:MAG: hypothetical protein HC834_10975 [Rhodospirillales bacterium]|nr:hypothetical protein [Rhodospirillales bacterium]